jgi:hypothetical protein
MIDEGVLNCAWSASWTSPSVVSSASFSTVFPGVCRLFQLDCARGVVPVGRGAGRAPNERHVVDSERIERLGKQAEMLAAAQPGGVIGGLAL